MTPTLGGTIDADFFSTYDATVQAALATGAYVIMDLVRPYIIINQRFTSNYPRV